MLLSLLLHGDAAASGGLFGYDAPRLHAVINDFPPALLVVGVLLELAYLFTKRESLRSASYWSLVIGAVSAAVALFSGLRAEDALEHGQSIHEIMQVHERFAWITLGCLRRGGGVAGAAGIEDGPPGAVGPRPGRRAGARPAHRDRAWRAANWCSTTPPG